jgi:HSP20 family protein
MYKGMYKGAFHPWHDLRNLKHDIHRVVNEFLGSEPEWEGGYWRPGVDVVETDDAYIVAAELPGMKKEDIKINVQEATLTISGEREPFSDDKNQLRSEFCYGPFRRSIPIPGEVNRDQIAAKYENGILQVTLPKKEQSKAKEIKIEVK